MKTATLAFRQTLAVTILAGIAIAQVASPPVDPGVQAANRGTGAALTAIQNNPFNAFFTDGQSRFQAVEQVSGSPTGNNGLGPRFNLNQCSGCHSQPAVGGSGAAMNPEFGIAGSPIAPDNTSPSFIVNNGPSGPTLEARFPFFYNANGTVNMNNPNGGVEELFTVAGRSDTNPNCQLQQPNFAKAVAANNIIFRIPTPTFGAGLIENLDDSTLLNYLAAQAANQFMIAGAVNHNGNDGTITRFGWKAQNKSMHIFAGEAYNVEMGISNLLFQNDRPTPEEDMPPNLGLPKVCLNLSGGGYPEDTSNPTVVNVNNSSTIEALALDDVSAFANFMRFLAPPPTGNVILNGHQVSQQTIADGSAVFGELGCSVCHNASTGTTQLSSFTPNPPFGAGSLSLNPVAAYSDIEIHHMGALLADNVMQGDAGGDMFRTAPLWGLGQRIFLLHDGRTQNTVTAIEDHLSNGSEASVSAQDFENLIQSNPTAVQDLLDFLRSL